MQEWCKFGSRREANLQAPVSVRKTVRSMVSIVGTPSVCSPAPEPMGVFSGPWMGHQNVDLNQIVWQLFPQRWKTDLFKISRGLQFGVFNHGELPSSRCMASEGEGFYSGAKGSWEATVNTIPGFSLTESLPGKVSLWGFFLLGSATVTGHESSPFWSPDYFIEVSVY